MSNSKAIGVAYLDPEFSTCYVTEELGYASAAQGSVTQGSSKSTGVTLNESMGQITMNNATLNTLTNVTFTLTNNLISAKDVIILNVGSGATAGAYNCWISSMSAGTCTITLRNISGGNLSEAVVINYAIIHGA
jgi:translation initiation factor 2 gamma subunit (eIF-2gamma)